jgi:CheY-like chemotaxis protein
MPGEDGLWLMQQVRSLPGALGRTPAIALTALARSEDRARAMAVGYHVHLAKPIQLDELQSHIAALVGRDIGSGFHKVS